MPLMGASHPHPTGCHPSESWEPNSPRASRRMGPCFRRGRPSWIPALSVHHPPGHSRESGASVGDAADRHPAHPHPPSCHPSESWNPASPPPARAVRWPPASAGDTRGGLGTHPTTRRSFPPKREPPFAKMLPSPRCHPGAGRDRSNAPDPRPWLPPPLDPGLRRGDTAHGPEPPPNPQRLQPSPPPPTPNLSIHPATPVILSPSARWLPGAVASQAAGGRRSGEDGVGYLRVRRQRARVPKRSREL